MKKFKCNDCGHVFMGSDFTTECPECGSTNIVEIKSESSDLIGKIRKWINENKILAGAIFIILLLFMFRSSNKNDNGSSEKINKIYSIQLIQNESQISVFLVDEDDIKAAYSEAKFGWLNLFASIVSESGVEYIAKITGNKISVCSSGDLTVNWKYDKKKLDSKYQSGFRVFEDLEVKLNDSECIPIVKVTSVSADVCAKRLYVKKYPKELSSKIFVSLTGKDGDYFNTNSLKFPNDKKLDVWFYYENFPNTKFRYNGETPDISNDSNCDKKTIKSRSDALISAFNTSNFDLIDEKIDWFKDGCKIEYNSVLYSIETFPSFTQTIKYQKVNKQININYQNIEYCGCEISFVSLD